MIAVAVIVWLLAHTAAAPAFAVDAWAWMCHHILLTILILLVAA